jgi:hypothetical protein
MAAPAHALTPVQHYAKKEVWVAMTRLLRGDAERPGGVFGEFFDK